MECSKVRHYLDSFLKTASEALAPAIDATAPIIAKDTSTLRYAPSKVQHMIPRVAI